MQITGKDKKEVIEKLLSKGSINWPKEMKIFSKLEKMYGESGFWLGVSPGFALPSLAWFLTPKGLDFLKVEWAKFNLSPEERKKYVEEEKVDFAPSQPIINNPKRRIKTLKDFLNIK